MSPRGKVKQLIEAMQAKPEQALWTPTECAKAMGLEHQAVNQSLRSAVSREWLFKHQGSGRSVFYSLKPEQEEPVEPPAFSAAAWVDGDVDLYGLIELEDGGYRMTADMVIKLKRLISWMPAPARTEP